MKASQGTTSTRKRTMRNHGETDHKRTARVMLMVLLLPNVSFAQQESLTPITDAANKVACDEAHVRAEEDAKHVGGMGLGLATGFVFPGAGVFVARQMTEQPAAPENALLDRDDEYVRCYMDRYPDAAMKRKKRNRLIGAVIGSAALFIIVISLPCKECRPFDGPI